jgi:anti-sigma-K factor RskA
MKTHDQFAEDLALYALGDLVGADRQELEEHLASCAACRRELQGLRADMSLLALSSAGPKPPERAKERLMRAVAAEPRGRGRETVAAPVESTRHGFGWGWIPALAALALLLVAAGLWRNNTRLKDQLAELRNRNQDQAVQLEQARDNLRLLTSPDAVHVSLNPQKMPKQPSGTAIFSRSQKRMLFMASNMAPPPPGKAYELWIIPKSGDPVPAGVFKPDEHGNAVMMDHPMPPGVEAKAFAVTMEKEEGADKPTMPILIVGAGE